MTRDPSALPALEALAGSFRDLRLTHDDGWVLLRWRHDAELNLRVDECGGRRDDPWLWGALDDEARSTLLAVPDLWRLVVRARQEGYVWLGRDLAIAARRAALPAGSGGKPPPFAFDVLRAPADGFPLRAFTPSRVLLPDPEPAALARVGAAMLPGERLALDAPEPPTGHAALRVASLAAVLGVGETDLRHAVAFGLYGRPRTLPADIVRFPTAVLLIGRHDPGCEGFAVGLTDAGPKEDADDGLRPLALIPT